MKLSTQAYCKMVLHGAKYPHCAVNGLLVAEKQQQQQQPGQRGREREAPPPPPQALLVDCIPLFHGSLALAPMLEVALSLVRRGGGRESLPGPAQAT
ncbi:ER membrane protein complex subunit 8-like [Notechis scutatus]|uniref:ER membrane protein complex subunit 8-like n=1 Tax=Notechis scutatus TaxID=8663 RepID=A0A6J1VQW9_9SAUR|nr:ER membrane protein complex subunit 8-like [Notechis scutatus]